LQVLVPPVSHELLEHMALLWQVAPAGWLFTHADPLQKNPAAHELSPPPLLLGQFTPQMVPLQR
jgi:hypothetical protein